MPYTLCGREQWHDRLLFLNWYTLREFDFHAIAQSVTTIWSPCIEIKNVIARDHTLVRLRLKFQILQLRFFDPAKIKWTRISLASYNRKQIDIFYWSLSRNATIQPPKYDLWTINEREASLYNANFSRKQSHKKRYIKNEITPTLDERTHCLSQNNWRWSVDLYT